MNDALSKVLVALLCAFEIGVLVYLLIKVSKEEPTPVSSLQQPGKKPKIQQQFQKQKKR